MYIKESNLSDWEKTKGVISYGTLIDALLKLIGIY